MRDSHFSDESSARTCSVSCGSDEQRRIEILELFAEAHCMHHYEQLVGHELWVLENKKLERQLNHAARADKARRNRQYRASMDAAKRKALRRRHRERENKRYHAERARRVAVPPIPPAPRPFACSCGEKFATEHSLLAHARMKRHDVPHLALSPIRAFSDLSAVRDVA